MTKTYPHFANKINYNINAKKMEINLRRDFFSFALDTIYNYFFYNI